MAPTWFTGPYVDTIAHGRRGAHNVFMSELSKETLRTEARRHRARIDPRGENPADAVTHFFQSIHPQKKQVIAGYWPAGTEFDVKPFLERLLEEGFTCVLPVMQKDSRILKFARWEENTNLQKGTHEIYQPPVTDKTEWLEPDIVIVPLLAFDRRGYRLGHGGGHYDATLADLRKKKNIVAVGAAYGQQAVLFNFPVEEHDQKLDWIVTPQGAQNFE